MIHSLDIFAVDGIKKRKDATMDIPLPPDLANAPNPPAWITAVIVIAALTLAALYIWIRPRKR